LEMTRLSVGKVELKKEIQPLEEVVGAALSQLEKKLEGRPVATDLPEDLPMLPLDSLLMEQVFINLLENAVKYTPDGSAIHISAHAKQTFLEVSVLDSGPGLQKGDEEKIFEKFYRGKTPSEQGGVGLGLAICRAVVEAHGGRIWAENRQEGGASFRFTLPITGEGITSITK
ncbi:MAG TPA: ATP-binding protein, partial [bacterium]|nr:ATP-binding protein [bacterium]